MTTSSYNSLNQLTGQQGGGTLKLAGTINQPSIVSLNGAATGTNPATSFAGQVAVTSGTNVVTTVATNQSGLATTNKFQIVVPPGSTTNTRSYDADGDLTGDGTRTYEWDGVILGFKRRQVQYGRASAHTVSRTSTLSVKSFLIITLIALCLVGCSKPMGQSPQPYDNFRVLRGLKNENAGTDAKKAIAIKDYKFLAVNGFTTEVPGVSRDAPELRVYGFKAIEGTSDAVEGPEHETLIANARSYAAKYNRELLSEMKAQVH